ncbi:MAG: glutathione S-transferase family protein [Candidatus Omnitrophica bacterium]|nr:glutathione S-transferase family protein [Candidatus Omnitrophota bacterium]
MANKIYLVIGNKNYSSWSMRPWILLKYFKIPFQEIFIQLYEGNYKEQLLKYSPSGKVPALVHGSLHVSESLAICEYIADLYPKKTIWPSKKGDRAWARSISAEMHAGFIKIRRGMPMNIRGSYPGKGRTPEVDMDIKRIVEIWTECRKTFKKKGPFLFGHFTVADAMFLPVVTRFRTYGVETSGLAAEYVQTMLNLPEFKEWEKAGIKEPWFIKASEIYNPKYQSK